MLDFNDWLKEKAEAHERMKTISLKGKTEDDGSVSATKTKTSSKDLAANANAKQRISSKTSQSAKNDQLACVLCKCQHPIWRSLSFEEKTPTQRAKFAAEDQLSFSCSIGKHSFQTFPYHRKCTHRGF